jgi:hypothetical protein
MLVLLRFLSYSIKFTSHGLLQGYPMPVLSREWIMSSRAPSEIQRWAAVTVGVARGLNTVAVPPSMLIMSCE